MKSEAEYSKVSDEEKPKKDDSVPSVGIKEFFRYLKGGDKFLLIAGSGAAILTGFGLPSFVFLFKYLTTSFSPTELDPENPDAGYGKLTSLTHRPNQEDFSHVPLCRSRHVGRLLCLLCLLRGHL